MCDDFTASAEERALAQIGLTRRRFAALGAAATLGACAPKGTGEGVGAGALREAIVAIPTPAGTADAFVVHPASGRHPAIIMWPDIAGLRDAFRAMARRLAQAGFVVLVPNQYYRSSPAPVLDSFAQWRTPEGQAKLQPMIAAITPAATLADAAAFIAFLDRHDAVDRARRIGTCGYCMGGPHAVRAAVAAPARVGAVASFHGARLVSGDVDSPHRLLGQTSASYLFAIGRNDDARAPADKTALRDAAAAAGRPAQVEVFPADHGWCVPDTPVYDAAQADIAWQRMLALFAAL